MANFHNFYSDSSWSHDLCKTSIDFIITIKVCALVVFFERGTGASVVITFVGKSRKNISKKKILKLDASIKRMTKSGQHSQGSTASELDNLVKRTAQFNIFTELKGRTYKHFYEFKRDRLENLNGSLLYQWINKHKKNILHGESELDRLFCELSILLLTYD